MCRLCQTSGKHSSAATGIRMKPCGLFWIYQCLQMNTSGTSFFRNHTSGMPTTRKNIQTHLYITLQAHTRYIWHFDVKLLLLGRRADLIEYCVGNYVHSAFTSPSKYDLQELKNWL